MKKIINKERLFGSLFLIAGIILIYYSSSVNENLEGNFYNFYFDIAPNPEDKAHLYNFMLFYDFTEGKGNISFRLDDFQLNYFLVDFPRFVDKQSVELLIINKNGTIRDLNYNITVKDTLKDNPMYSYILVEDIHEKLYRDNLIITFRTDMLPKGRFYFYNNKYMKLHSRVDGNINFILGDDYECIFNCIYELKDIKERWNSFDNNLKLEFLRQDEDVQDHAFKLNAISRKERFKRNLSLGLGISLLTAGLVLFIQSFKKRLKSQK